MTERVDSIREPKKSFTYCWEGGCSIGLVVVVTDQLISSAGFPLIGGGGIGFGVGYLLKKLIKLAFIALGLIALLLGYLEYQRWITVNWMVAENQTSIFMTHAVNKLLAVTQNMNHEVPIGMSLLGFAPGVPIGFYKG